ncbi:hypothetical protein [Brevibacterium casei]|uniref:hypothetical protein n=1 Tax=Brevibacterium casei TaxID=33889 RepID=UPI00242049AD|nr:hypothetical protein [Brevibacterium casei]
MGTVARQGENRHTLGGDNNATYKPRPHDYASKNDLPPGGNQAGIYDMTDNVTDEEFNDTLDQAWGERNGWQRAFPGNPFG